jgi:MoaA/NifB/PqqE/SkfB family radical SAM enzyme
MRSAVQPVVSCLFLFLPPLFPWEITHGCNAQCVHCYSMPTLICNAVCCLGDRNG